MRKETMKIKVVDWFFSGYEIQEIYRKLVNEEKIKPEQASEMIFEALRHPNV